MFLCVQLLCCVRVMLLCFFGYFVVFELCCCVFSYFVVIELCFCVFGYFVGVFEICFCMFTVQLLQLHKFVCREFYELKVPAVTPLLANYNHPCLTQ